MHACQVTTITPKLLTESTSAAAIAKNPIIHQRTEHIERVLCQEFTLGHVDTRLNVTDRFTKPLVDALFCNLVQNLGLLELHRLVANG